MAKHIRHCPNCYQASGDTYEFECSPPVGESCDDCGSRLLPLDPEVCEREGWLEPRDYSESYEEEAFV
jgi:hypothetical protein